MHKQPAVCFTTCFSAGEAVNSFTGQLSKQLWPTLRTIAATGILIYVGNGLVNRLDKQGTVNSIVQKVPVEKSDNPDWDEEYFKFYGVMKKAPTKINDVKRVNETSGNLNDVNKDKKDSSTTSIEHDKWVKFDGVNDVSMISTTKFKDVKGVDEAKAELEDIVHYLRNPKVGDITIIIMN
jgi:hypothetical protein